MSKRAVHCYGRIIGEFWRGKCEYCTWTSKNLPFKTKAEAEHAVDLHEVLCKNKPEES